MAIYKVGACGVSMHVNASTEETSTETWHLLFLTLIQQQKTKFIYV